jgi:hypothetical protein
MGVEQICLKQGHDLCNICTSLLKSTSFIAVSDCDAVCSSGWHCCTVLNSLYSHSMYTVANKKMCTLFWIVPLVCDTADK